MGLLDGRLKGGHDVEGVERTLKLDAFLRLDAGREVMLDGAHLGDAIGKSHQLRLGVAACHDDVQIMRGGCAAFRSRRRREDNRSAARC